MACTPLSGRSGGRWQRKCGITHSLIRPNTHGAQGSRGVAADQQSVGSAARPVVQTRDLRRSPDYEQVAGRYDVEIGAGAKVTIRT
jgi:hypothetical protein